VINIFNNNRINLVAILVTIGFLVALSVFVGFTSGNLGEKASEGEEGNIVQYDVLQVMSYYIDAMQNEGTLLHKHYIQETSKDVQVECSSCHEIKTLRTLFTLADSKANSDQDKIMTRNSIETCLSCHGTYAEVAELTKDTKIAAFFNVNFHDPSFMINGPKDPIKCTICHIVHGKSSIDANFCHTCHMTINPSK
jgi:Zn finger protein HypA/HybF involved in hydrogenase expression